MSETEFHTHTKQVAKLLTCTLFSEPTALGRPHTGLRQDKHQDMRQKRQKLTSASWLRPVCGGFHNLIRSNCAPFFASCRRHRVLTVTRLDACRCAAYLRQTHRPGHWSQCEHVFLSGTRPTTPEMWRKLEARDSLAIKELCRPM
jgi:hypothetical protein